MKAIIRAVDLYRLKIPLRHPFVISLGALHEAQSVIVRIHTHDGLTGWGECSPFMTINGESTETGIAVGNVFAGILPGKNALEIAAIIELMDAVIYGNNSIKSAFDMALHDLAAQYREQPLYQFLGGRIEKPVFTDYTVSLSTPEAMALQAAEIKAAGFTVIKVKLGQHGPTDVERIRAIREAIGSELPLRIDANQGWQRQEAIDTLRALAPYHIQHAEEPIARWDFMNLPAIRAASPIPIMADESCCDLHDLERLILLKACDKINIKLGKCGGLHKALKMLRLAEAHQLPVQLGAFLESRLGMTAFTHLAHCSTSVKYFDFDTALMFSEDPVSGGVQYKEQGLVELPPAAGIGATISEG